MSSVRLLIGSRRSSRLKAPSGPFTWSWIHIVWIRVWGSLKQTQQQRKRNYGVVWVFKICNLRQRSEKTVPFSLFNFLSLTNFALKFLIQSFLSFGVSGSTRLTFSASTHTTVTKSSLKITVRFFNPIFLTSNFCDIYIYTSMYHFGVGIMKIPEKMAILELRMIHVCIIWS